MNIRIYLILLVSIFSVSSCQNEKATQEKASPVTTDLQVDHVNIWVNNPKEAQQLLTNLGFVSIPDSLSEVHAGQGTTGRYFYFLNSYLELIFVYDQNELEENVRKNKDLDFAERANFEENGASPFSIALNLEDYDTAKIPFEKVPYHQGWMEENSNIYSAKKSKTHLQEPSIFVVYPKLVPEQFETLADLKNIPDEYAFVREFYKHPNGVKKLTSIAISSPGLDLNTETIRAVNAIENLTVKIGTEHLMELYFDNQHQGKSYDLRPELPLIIYF